MLAIVTVLFLVFLKAKLSMAHSIYAVANTLRQLSSERLTSMHIQRLLYLAQARCLKANQTVLHDDVAVRWPTGPVVPSLFHKLRDFGPEVVDRDIVVAGGGVPVVPLDGHLVRAILHSVLQDYGHLPVNELTASLTQPGSAWAQTPEGQPISNELLAVCHG